MTDNSELKTQQLRVDWDAPGKRILVRAGIVYALFGGIALIYQVWSFRLFLMFLARPQDVLYIIHFAGASIVFRFLFTTFLIFFPVLYILVGIIGIRNCNNIEKANKLRFLGAACLAVEIFRIVSVYIIYGTFNLWHIVLSLILPVVYLYGAQKNLGEWKKQTKTM